MATLRHSNYKSGNYSVDFYIGGKRFVRSTKTNNLKTAKLILKEIEIRIAKGIFQIDGITPRKKISLKDFAKEFLEYSLAHKALSTFHRDKLVFKNLMHFLGNKSLDFITNRVIKQYLDSRISEVTKSTANLELRHLKAAFTLAVNWGYLEKNPCVNIKPFSIPSKAPLFFTNQDIAELLNAIQENWLRNIVAFAVNTGVRISELINLKWSDVGIEKRVVIISNKDDFVTKSKRERTIPMNDKVLNLLTGLPKQGDYVFSIQNGEKPNYKRISKHFKRYIIETGLNEKFTFHSTRHTFASHLVQSGVSLYKVSKLLGHSNLKTTEIYAHLDTDTLHDVVRLLDGQEGGYPQLGIIR